MSLDSIRLTKCVDYLEKIMLLIEDEDRNSLQEMINRYTRCINTLNRTNLSVINPTKSESGRILATLKRITTHHHLSSVLDKIMKDLPREPTQDSEDTYEIWLTWWNERRRRLDIYDVWVDEIKELCDKTTISKTTKSAKILLGRRCNHYNRSPLEKELNENIKLLMLQDFNNQNQEFITKTINYEANK